jgi:hypothetical protein
MALDKWRTATISLAFLLVLVCVAWAMREQSIAADRRREREQWEVDRRLMLEQNEEQRWEIQHLARAFDELRRGRHHATTRPAGGNDEGE